MMVVIIAEEMRITYLHILNNQAEADAARTDLYYYWAMSTSFVKKHGVHIQMCACICSFASVVISYSLSDPATWLTTTNWYDPAAAGQTAPTQVYQYNLTWMQEYYTAHGMDASGSTVAGPTTTAHGRLLRAGGGGGASSPTDINLYNSWEITNEGEWPTMVHTACPPSPLSVCALFSR